MTSQIKTKPAVDEVAASNEVATEVAVDKNVTAKNNDADNASKGKRPYKSAKKPTLKKDDEIPVVSLIPNVSYKDFSTDDIYTWDKIGEEVYMTFDVVQRLWQKSKTYFKAMWLKPCDDRVIEKFGLTNLYSKYDFLMDKSNYTKDNIDTICESVASTPNELKTSICNKIKSMVSSGDVSDISVIRALEKGLQIDLIYLID